MTQCDKCHQVVPPENDATIIESVAYNNTVLSFFVSTRHFLPVEGCEGSPSRAQYIQGQPRDSRGYKYYPEFEVVWRVAYAKVQKRYKK